MGIKQLYNDNLRKLPNEYGDVSVMNIQNYHLSGNIYTIATVTEIGILNCHSVIGCLFDCGRLSCFLL